MLTKITNKIPYIITGSVPASFEIPFRYFEKSEIKVLWSLDQTARPGIAPIVLNEGVDYNLTEPGETGILTRVGTWDTDGIKLTVYREVELKQKVDLRNGDKYDADKIENMGDYIMAAVQQVHENISRTVRIPITDDFNTDLMFPTQEERAGHGIAFDVTGKKIIGSDRDLIACTPFIETLCDDETAGEARKTLDIEGLSGILAEDVSAGGAVSLTESGWKKCLRKQYTRSEIVSGTGAADFSSGGKWGDKFIFVCSDNNYTGQGMIRIGHVADDYSIAYDCPMTLFSAASHDIDYKSACGIDDDHFAVFFKDNTDSLFYVRVGHLDSGSIVWDTAILDTAMYAYLSNLNNLKIKSIDPANSRFIIMAKNPSSTAVYSNVVRIGYLSGSSIVWDTVVTGVGKASAYTKFWDFTPLGTSDFAIFVSSYDGTLYNNEIYWYSFSGATITLVKSDNLGPFSLPNTSSLFYYQDISCDKISDSKAIVIYRVQTDTTTAGAILDDTAIIVIIDFNDIGNATSASITTTQIGPMYKDFVIFGSSVGIYIGYNDANKVGITIEDRPTKSMNTIIFELNGYELSPISTPIQNQDSVSDYPFDGVSCWVAEDKYVVIYRANPGNYAYARCIRVNDFNGVALEEKSTPEVCKIKYSGLLTGLSSLVIGKKYKINWDTGALEEYSGDGEFLPHVVGKAVSTTELLIGG